MIKFLHLSDIHVNAPFISKRQEVREALKESVLASFEKAVNYALTENLDAVLIVGDFLDHAYLEYRTESRLTSIFMEALTKGLQVFYCTGNHDPITESTMFSSLKSHDNFHIFDQDIVEKVQCISKSGYPYSVVACGHKTKFEKRNLIKSFPKNENNDLIIGMAHASVHSIKSVEEKEKYLPTTLKDIESLNYQYFALGHIHLRQILSNRVAYSGNIQGLNIKETGGRGGIVCSVSDQSTQLKEVNFNDIHWTQIPIDVDPKYETLKEIEEWLITQIVDEVNQVKAPAIKQVVRIHLKGRSRLYAVLKDEGNLGALEERIRNILGLLDLSIETDQLHRVLDIDVLKNETTVLAEALDALFAPENHPTLLKRLQRLELTKAFKNDDEAIKWLKTHENTLLNELIDRMVIEENDH